MNAWTFLDRNAWGALIALFVVVGGVVLAVLAAHVDAAPRRPCFCPGESAGATAPLPGACSPAEVTAEIHAGGPKP